MSEARYFKETSCPDCGYIGPHAAFSNPWYAHKNHGGVRREVTIDYEAARIAARHMLATSIYSTEVIDNLADVIMDAALVVEPIDP